MTVRPTQRLSDALARRVVTHSSDCLKRAEIPRPAFAASHPVEGFERVYDTLVLEYQPYLGTASSSAAPGVSSQPRSRQAQTPAELVREALLLLHALSFCPGYAFHENFGFWNATLAQADPPTGAMSAKTGLQFPRVVLDWNPRYDGTGISGIDGTASLRKFESSVLALFTTSSSRRLSKNGRKLLANLRELQASVPESMTPLQCVVSIRFARAAKDTKALVDSVISATKALSTQAAAQSQIQSEFAWVGVCLNGSSNVYYPHRGLFTLANLKLLRRMCVSLPPSIAFDFALPRSDPYGRRSMKDASTEPLAAFLMLAIGVSGTELLGRLTVLDLTYSSNGLTTPATLDFASLCTLLPLSRSLQKLRVTAESKLDHLWLVYAATHPMTPATQWRALHLEIWAHLDRVVAFSSLLSALWTETTYPSTPSTTTTATVVPTDHYVRRTAKIAQHVQFLSPNKTNSFVPLVKGHDVELCDTTTALDELVLETGDPDLDDVAVVVAGVGLGWVHKRHLTQVTDTRYEGAPRSCLTTLIMAFHEEDVIDLNNILPFFGPELRHLSASGALQTAIGDVPRVCPRLETLEMAVLIQGEDHELNTLLAMPYLRFVGLVCTNLSSLVRNIDWLQSLPCLDTVRMLLGSPSEYDPEWDYFTANDPGWVAIATEAHLTAFIGTKTRTLRSLTVIHTEQAAAAQAGVDDRLSCGASSKRALLSVLHRARDEERQSRSALARVDSDVVRLVFDLAGPSMTRRVVQAYDMWPSDWYDSHSSDN